MNDADQTIKTENFVGVLNVQIDAKMSEGGMGDYEDTLCSNRFEAGCKGRPYCKMENGDCAVYSPE